MENDKGKMTQFFDREIGKLESQITLLQTQKSLLVKLKRQYNETQEKEKLQIQKTSSNAKQAQHP